LFYKKIPLSRDLGFICCDGRTSLKIKSISRKSIPDIKKYDINYRFHMRANGGNNLLISRNEFVAIKKVISRLLQPPALDECGWLNKKHNLMPKQFRKQLHLR
jgi:hypothetical protein